MSPHNHILYISLISSYCNLHRNINLLTSRPSHVWLFPKWGDACILKFPWKCCWFTTWGIKLLINLEYRRDKYLFTYDIYTSPINLILNIKTKVTILKGKAIQVRFIRQTIYLNWIQYNIFILIRFKFKLFIRLRRCWTTASSYLIRLKSLSLSIYIYSSIFTLWRYLCTLIILSSN